MQNVAIMPNRRSRFDPPHRYAAGSGLNSAFSCQRADLERVTGGDRKVTLRIFNIYPRISLMTKLIAALVAAMFAAGAVYAPPTNHAKKDDKKAAATKKDDKKAEAKK